MKKIILFFCCIVFLGGCANWGPYTWRNEGLLEPIVVFPSFSSNYLLSCLSDMQTLKNEEFDAKFESAEAGLKHGRNLAKLRFVCLSLNKKANYKQFEYGLKVLDEYLKGQPGSGEDMQGFRIMVERLDEEIMNKWRAWKTLRNDKKELTAEVESLKVRIEEQQKQIEQLKNIENIIKSRETDKP